MNSATVDAKILKDWVDVYTSANQKWEEFTYPSETLVRLFKGSHITGKRLETAGKSILDIGFGDGNNTLFLASLGMKVSGIEIEKSICNRASERMLRQGVMADLRVGSNQHIPFADSSFDFLVSWNVLHYEGTETGVEKGIQEYCRVLKPGGRLLLSTTGPESPILLNAKTLGNHRYEIRRPNDFRSGQVHFFFDAPQYLEYYFSPYLNDLKIGRIEDKLFTAKLDWWLLTGLKG